MDLRGIVDPSPRKRSAPLARGGSHRRASLPTPRAHPRRARAKPATATTASRQADDRGRRDERPSSPPTVRPTPRGTQSERRRQPRRPEALVLLHVLRDDGFSDQDYLEWLTGHLTSEDTAAPAASLGPFSPSFPCEPELVGTPTKRNERTPRCAASASSAFRLCPPYSVGSTPFPRKHLPVPRGVASLPERPHLPPGPHLYR